MNPIHEVEFEDLDSSGREELELRDAPEVQAGPAGEYIRIELLADKYPFNALFLKQTATRDLPASTRLLLRPT